MLTNINLSLTKVLLLPPTKHRCPRRQDSGRERRFFNSTSSTLHSHRPPWPLSCSSTVALNRNASICSFSINVACEHLAVQRKFSNIYLISRRQGCIFSHIVNVKTVIPKLHMKFLVSFICLADSAFGAVSPLQVLHIRPQNKKVVLDLENNFQREYSSFETFTGLTSGFITPNYTPHVRASSCHEAHMIVQNDGSNCSLLDCSVRANGSRRFKPIAACWFGGVQETQNDRWVWPALRSRPAKHRTYQTAHTIYHVR